MNRQKSSTDGGNRTHTGVPAQRILSPLVDLYKSNSINDLRQSASALTAQGQRAASNDPDLADLITALIADWPRLPDVTKPGIKAGIPAMVKAAAGSADAQRAFSPSIRSQANTLGVSAAERSAG